MTNTMSAPRAEGIDCAAPDWRALAPSTQAVPYRTPQIRLARHERDWFFWLAYSAGLRPGALLRRFAEAYASGAPVPRTELGEPKNKLRLIRPSDRVAFFLHARNRNVEASIWRGRMPTACRSARSCAVSLSTTCGESELRELLKTRPSSRNRSGRREIEPPERMRPARKCHVRAGLSFSQRTRPTKAQ